RQRLLRRWWRCGGGLLRRSGGRKIGGAGTAGASGQREHRADKEKAERLCEHAPRHSAGAAPALLSCSSEYFAACARVRRCVAAAPEAARLSWHKAPPTR